jgi:C4-dicarboxylate-specific signal transduction histidine kinase
MNHLTRKEVAFFGKITAGITHEIKNVLAIIQESSGLMEDILNITENGTFPHKDKFITSLNRISRQIQRGIDVTSRLNRFAHSPDHCPASLDLNDITEQMVLLASRFARLKNVVLESSPSDPPLIIKSDPVSLEMALFESIEILLNAIGSGGKITLSPRKIQSKCVLGVGYENTVLPEEDFMAKISSTERWASLQEIMARLGGAAKVFGLAPEILLYLPESIDD